METASLGKRILIFVANTILSLGCGFAAATPFLVVLHWHPALYVIYSLAFSGITCFILEFLVLLISKGYTIGSAIVGVKFVSPDAKKISAKQMTIRAICESVYMFAIFDLGYFIKNKTERGIIDRLCDSFAIDIFR